MTERTTRQAQVAASAEDKPVKRSANRYYKDRDIKILGFLSGNRCAFPGCDELLVAKATERDPAAVVGEFAHIVAASSDGPRGSEKFDGDINGHENLILLCPTHHDVVDNQPNTYSSQDLRVWKAEHEAWVTETLTVKMRNLQFAELDVVCQHLVANKKGIESTAMISVDIRDKMEVNGLTDQVAQRLTTGLMQASQVANFLAKYSSMFDRELPRRLRERFVEMYTDRLQEGLSGDALFLQLAEDATPDPPPGSNLALRWDYQAAALAVLSHLFEICDVFEAP